MKRMSLSPAAAATVAVATITAAETDRHSLIKIRCHFMGTIVHGIKYAMQETTL